jgi:uncharacterized protein (TIGR00369 family)
VSSEISPVLPATRSCYVCGTANPLGLHIGFHIAGTAAETRFSFRPEFSGFRDTVHGGVISTVLDEVMVWAIGIASGKFVYCGELTVRFLRPTATRAEVVARGEVTENKRGRLFFARAELRNAAGELLAEATGKYLPVPESVTDAVLEDFQDGIPPFFQKVSQPPSA